MHKTEVPGLLDTRPVRRRSRDRYGHDAQVGGSGCGLTMYDAAYVALAKLLDCPLVTADRKLAAAPGLVCLVERL